MEDKNKSKPGSKADHEDEYPIRHHLEKPEGLIVTLKRKRAHSHHAGCQ